MHEQRKYVRLEKELKLGLERKGPTGTLRGEGTTKNISPMGLCMITRASLGVGEKIIISLSLPDVPKPLSLEGRITWSRSSPAISSPLHEVGIHFSPPTDSDHNHYLLFLSGLLCDKLVKQEFV